MSPPAKQVSLYNITQGTLLCFLEERGSLKRCIDSSLIHSPCLMCTAPHLLSSYAPVNQSRWGSSTMMPFLVFPARSTCLSAQKAHSNAFRPLCRAPLFHKVLYHSLPCNRPPVDPPIHFHPPCAQH
jgi:hypothetical protein